MKRSNRPPDGGFRPPARPARTPRLLGAVLLPAGIALALLASRPERAAAHFTSAYCGHGTQTSGPITRFRFVSHRDVRHDTRTYHVHTYAHEQRTANGWGLLHYYDNGC